MESIKVQDHNRITEYAEDDKAIFTKTDTYISDQMIADYAAINDNIRENRRKMKSDMEFLGRIPITLYDSVKNGIREKMTSGSHDAECYFFTKEGEKELDELTIKTIFATDDYKYLLGK